jgi:galactitol-specific phosphotransferase system IIB component
MMKFLLVCGSGIVSCTLVAPTIEDMLREMFKANFELIKGSFLDIPSYITRIDCILTTVPLSQELKELAKRNNVGVVIVTDIFAGKKEKVKEEIVKMLKETKRL